MVKSAISEQFPGMKQVVYHVYRFETAQKAGVLLEYTLQ
jgi:hypothetical protein